MKIGFTVSLSRGRKMGLCACRGLAMAGLLLGTLQLAMAQAKAIAAADPARPIKERVLSGSFPGKPSLPALWTIPVEPFGFSPPGPLYLGQRNSLASLDFIGEDRLLFTFRVPGLIRRTLKAGEIGEGDERKIRAVVLKLPEGNVESEGLWTVHDRARYLWMLKDGHFLLRDENNLQEGDAHLALKPLLQFPGDLLGVELDPSQQYIVANSHEPAATPSKAGQLGSPATASATMTQDSESSSSDSGAGQGSDAAEAQQDNVVRILRRDTGRVMLVSRVRSSVHLPINSEGYLETLRGRGEDWVLNLNFFTGGSRILGHVSSSCYPNTLFLSQQEVLVSGCDSSGSRKLVAMTIDGRTLWQDLNPDTAIWPLLTASADGMRLIQETLAATHAVSAYAPLGTDDLKGQLVRVLDAATGEVAFESPASPALDSGGNVAISPSSRLVAVMNGGAIQVFELPAAPGLPEPKGQAAH